MDPLVITATPNICWLKPDVSYPRTTAALVREAVLCRKAGAAILHMHAERRWVEAIRAVRDATDLIVQCGMSSLAIPERMDVFTHGADEISIILGHHDEAFTGLDVYALHPRTELLEYCRLSRKRRVLLELEVWSTGHLWNLDWLIKRRAIGKPYVTTLFFGWPGGQWSPPTIREYMSRREHVPDGSFVTVSVMGPEQRDIIAAAIVNGDHVRVGTEDYPYDRRGKIAPTHRLVKEVAEVSRSLGRPVASPGDARKLLGK
jgi:3-keto-5-aminohexanoate cleavage enzyme